MEVKLKKYFFVEVFLIIFIFILSFSFLSAQDSNKYSQCDIYGTCQPTATKVSGGNTTIYQNITNNNNYYNVTQNFTYNITNNQTFYVNTTYNITNNITTNVQMNTTQFLDNSTISESWIDSWWLRITSVTQQFIKDLGFYTPNEEYNKTQVDNLIINNKTMNYSYPYILENNSVLNQTIASYTSNISSSGTSYAYPFILENNTKMNNTIDSRQNTSLQIQNATNVSKIFLFTATNSLGWISYTSLNATWFSASPILNILESELFSLVYQKSAIDTMNNTLTTNDTNLLQRITSNNNTAVQRGSSNQTLVSCLNITGGSDADFCTDATGVGGGGDYYPPAQDKMIGWLVPKTMISTGLNATGEIPDFTLIASSTSTGIGMIKGYYINYTTAPANLSYAGGVGIADSQARYFPYQKAKIYTTGGNQNNLTNYSIWFGLASNLFNNTNGTGLTTNQFYVLKFTNATGIGASAGNDLTWHACSGDGTTASCDDTGVKVFPLSFYQLEINITSLNSMYWAVTNSTTKVSGTKTTNLNATGNVNLNLTLYSQMVAYSGSIANRVRNLLVESVYQEKY